MANLFNPSGPVFRFIVKVEYSIWLNILWFLCCIPIVTIGPATTALYYCMQHIVLDEDSYITKMFFRSFKENFKQSMLVGIIMTILGVIMGLDGYALYHLRTTSGFWAILTGIFLVAAVAYAIILMWIFPLLARYENTTLAMFKNAIMLSIRFLLCTFVMAVTYLVVFYVIINVFTPFIIFGMGLIALLNSWLFKNVFIQCELKQESKEEV